MSVSSQQQGDFTSGFFFSFYFFTSGFFRRISAQLQLNCENPLTASSCSTSKNWANPEGQAFKVLLFPLPQNDLPPCPPPPVFPADSICYSHPSLSCLQRRCCASGCHFSPSVTFPCFLNRNLISVEKSTASKAQSFIHKIKAVVIPGLP